MSKSGNAASRYKTRFASDKCRSNMYSGNGRAAAIRRRIGAARYPITTSLIHKQLNLPKKPGVSASKTSIYVFQPREKIFPIGIFSEVDFLFMVKSPKKNKGV